MQNTQSGTGAQQMLEKIQEGQRFQRQPDSGTPFGMSPIRVAMTDVGKARQDLLKLFDVLEDRLGEVLGPVKPEPGNSVSPPLTNTKVCSQMADMLNEEKRILEHAAVRLSSLIERIEV